MTTPMTIAEIERRLRFAAPDEPAILPPLTFPVTSGPLLRPAVRLRPRARSAQGVRLAYVVVALLLMAAAIAAGAWRLLETQRDPLAAACPADVVALPDDRDPCIQLPIPAGWLELGAGQLFPGDFTQPGIGYEVVNLVIANVPLGSCASPGGPPPTGIPVASNTYEIPRATPDPGLACLRAAGLPEDGLRIVVMRGTRIVGVAADGAGIADTSEPTIEAGWTEEVGGRPARLTVSTGAGQGAPAETRTWDVLLPRSLESVMRITADIAGPDVAAGRAAVQDFVDSIVFKLDTPELDAADANDVLRRVLDASDRGARGSHSDFYGCFPREPGRAAGTITGGPSAPLSGALAVTCESAIRPSAAGVWRISLAVTWDGTATYDGDTLRTELFSTGIAYPGAVHGEPEWSGGQFTSDAGRRMPDEGVDGWLPTANYVLPPKLAGPLMLPPGSLVEMLYPAEEIVADPGSGPPPDSIYPGFVGARLYVIDGPEIIAGEEWYQVQSGFNGWNQIGWVRGTRDGRPQLHVVAPACPSANITAGDVAWISAGERVACFGGAELTLERTILEPVDYDANAWFCADGSGDAGPCPTTPGTPDWLTLPTRWTMYGEGGSMATMPGMSVWLHPGVEPADDGQLVRVRGHFDDPEATGCTWPADRSYALEPQPPEIEELICRQRFVVTSIEQP